MPAERQAPCSPRRERLCAAAVRALTGDAALHYRDGRLCRGRGPLPLYAPHLRTDPFRGRFRLTARRRRRRGLRLMHCDADLHRRLHPRRAARARSCSNCSSNCAARPLAPRRHAGRRGEPAAALRRGRAPFTARASPTGISASCSTRSRRWRGRGSTGEPVLEETEGLIEATRAAHRAGARRLAGGSADGIATIRKRSPGTRSRSRGSSAR